MRLEFSWEVLLKASIFDETNIPRKSFTSIYEGKSISWAFLALLIIQLLLQVGKAIN